MSRILALLVIAACGKDAPPPPPAPPTQPPPADAAITPLTATAAYDNKQWDRCASEYTAVAATAPAKDKPELLYNAACCFARAGKPDRAFASLDAAVAAGFRSVEHVRADDDLAGVRADPRFAAALDRMKAAQTAWESSLGAPELRRELLALVEEDQAARMAYIDSKKAGKPVDMTAVTAIDKRSTAALKAAIAKHGWPGKSLVGDDGAHAAWLLVQHADADRALQKDALARMQPLVDKGEVTATDYAYLWDRIAVAEKRPQRYGTQFDNGEPAPMEDPANVDARRKSVGLGTLAEYKEQMRRMYGR